MKNGQGKYLFVTIKRSSVADIDEFVGVWSKAYNYANMDFYTGIIAKDKIEISDLTKLLNGKMVCR